MLLTQPSEAALLVNTEVLGSAFRAIAIDFSSSAVSSNRGSHPISALSAARVFGDERSVTGKLGRANAPRLATSVVLRAVRAVSGPSLNQGLPKPPNAVRPNVPVWAARSVFNADTDGRFVAACVRASQGIPR